MNSPLRHLARCCFAALLLLAAPLWAQTSRTGTVTGVVSNQATRDLLAGAIIAVEGSSATAVAERGGAYSITLPEGSQTLLVSFTGLDTQRVPVVVTAGQIATKDVELTTGLYKMEAFSVSGVREGSALAIQKQRLSDNPKLVVATDTFGNPASNPGELIQRLPGISTDTVGSEVRTIYVRGMGPGFSSLMVDGDRMATSAGTSASRDYQIEQLGTANLETVELIKAPQPEQDANAVAGFINLVSRRAFDTPGRRITLTGGVMWRYRHTETSPFEDKPDNLDLISLSYAESFDVFGGKKNLGIALNFMRRVSATTQDEAGPGGVLVNFANTYLNPTSDNPLTRFFGSGDIGYKARARNAGLTVDYKFTRDTFIYFNGAYNTNDQYQQYYRPGVGNTGATLADFAPGSTYDHSFLLPSANSVAISESTPNFTKNSRNFSFSGGGETKLLDRSLTLSTRASYSHADISYPGWTRLQARTGGGIGFEIDRRGQDPWFPIFRQTAGPSIYDPASYRMSTMRKQSYKAPNDVYTFRADATKRFDTAAPTSIKMGAKYTSDTRKPGFDLGLYTWTGADGLPNTADDSMAPYANLSYSQSEDRYGPFPFITNMRSPTDAPAGYWRQTAADAYTSVADAMNSKAEFKEEITAAYIQGTIKLGKLRILGGVRMEDTDTSGTAWARNTTAAYGGSSVGGTSLDPVVVEANRQRALRSFVQRNTIKGSYRKFFPGLHFTYEPVNSLLFRASYNKSISRPPVPNLIPTIAVNPDATPPTVSGGNPNLRPYMSDNFEVSVEKYFEPVGVISAGVFMKKIDDYFRTFVTELGPGGIDGQGLYAGYNYSTSQNIGSAEIKGLELNYRQQFSFLPGIFRGLGGYANFTYLKAEGDFGTTATTNKLANLSPRQANFGLTFRHRGFEAHVLGNYQGEKYKSTVSGIEVYNESRLTWDLKFQYAFNRRYDLFLDIVNITDEPPRTDVSLNGLKFFRTNQGVGFSLGARARF